MAQGTVKWFNADRGYGFIAVDDVGVEVFVHFSAIQTSGYATLEENQRVEVDITQGSRGLEVERVRVLAGGPRIVGTNEQGSPANVRERSHSQGDGYGASKTPDQIVSDPVEYRARSQGRVVNRVGGSVVVVVGGGGIADAGGEAGSSFAETSIPIEVYLDTEDEDDARRAFAAADNIARILGYGNAVDESVERGSIWRRARAHLRRGVESDEVKDRLVKLERAFELKHLDSQQADVDVKNAEAASQLIASMENIPQGTMRVGSFFLVKYQDAGTPTIHIRSLSQLEIRALERYPEIQKTPQKALEALATATLSLEGVLE